MHDGICEKSAISATAKHSLKSSLNKCFVDQMNNPNICKRSFKINIDK